MRTDKIDICDAPSESYLSALGVHEYWERGYWVSPKLFDDEQIERLRAAHERLWRGDFDGPASQYGQPKVLESALQVRQQCNAFWLNTEIGAAVQSPLLGAIAARLMRVPRVRLWHDQAIYKPGQGSDGTSSAGNVGWHQDYGYWQASDTTNLCTAWVALQDTDLGNGGMRTIVGSHRWGFIPGSDTFWEQDLDGLRERYQAKGEWLDEPCVLRAGQVTFHHALTLHGSGPNLSNAPRLSVVAHMMPADTRFSGSAQWHPNVVFLGPNPRAGQPFEGPCFPELWPRATG